MARTVRSCPSWVEEENAWKFSSDNIRRTGRIISEYEHLGFYYGYEIWGNGKVREKRRIRKQNRKRTQDLIRRGLFD